MWAESAPATAGERRSTALYTKGSTRLDHCPQVHAATSPVLRPASLAPRAIGAREDVSGEPRRVCPDAGEWPRCVSTTHEGQGRIEACGSPGRCQARSSRSWSHEARQQDGRTHASEAQEARVRLSRYAPGIRGLAVLHGLGYAQDAQAGRLHASCIRSSRRGGRALANSSRTQGPRAHSSSGFQRQVSSAS